MYLHTFFSLLFPDKGGDNKTVVFFFFLLVFQVIFGYFTTLQHRKYGLVYCLTAYMCFMINVLCLLYTGLIIDREIKVICALTAAL